MNKLLSILVLISGSYSTSFALTTVNDLNNDLDNEIVSVEVTDISYTENNCIIDCGDASKPIVGSPPPPPVINPPVVTPTTPSTTNTGGVTGSTTTTGSTATTGTTVTTPPDLSGIIPGNAGVVIGQIVAIGTKVWDFMINNKPTASYNTLKGSVVPAGITSWTQLTGWSRPKSKLFHVEFKTLRGTSAGGFDYRISLISGGNYRGKGKFIGQIGVSPENIKLHTDRSLNFRAELLDPINYGTEADPVAGVQLLIHYNSPTTLRYEMHSVQYYLYGTGEVQDLTADGSGF